MEIILPKYDIIKTKITEMRDVKSKNNIIEAHGGGGGQEIILTVSSKFRIPVFSVLRKYN